MTSAPPLLLGCAGVGKTLLVRQLKSIMEQGKITTDLETASTTGMELDTLTLREPPVAITVREVGSPMIPMWPSYYADCRAVVFVVDTAQPLQLSASFAEFLDVVAHPALAGKPFLLCLNKIDVPTRLSKAAMDSLFRLSDFDKSMKRSHSAFDVIECSAVSGVGLDEVAEWLSPGCGAPIRFILQN